MNGSTPQERLALALQRAGLTHRQLAALGSVSRSTLQRLRSGEVARLRMDTIGRVARALGCSAAWLAYGLEAAPLRLAPADALIVRVSLRDCCNAELQAWVDELRRAAPGHPVVVLLDSELETMPAEAALAERTRQLTSKAAPTDKDEAGRGPAPKGPGMVPCGWPTR